MNVVKPLILVVDDSVFNRSVLVDILENEYELIEAKDGQEALAIIEQRSHEISLVLLDLVMPKIDGFQVLSYLNNKKIVDELPVIIISSDISTSTIEEAYSLGAQEFIARPFDEKVVLRRTANVISLFNKQKRLSEIATTEIVNHNRSNRLMVSILSQIVEFRNGESGLHVIHINLITRILLNKLVSKTDKYHLSDIDIDNIVMASSLHDIGKIAIPEEILNKPGRLTPEEFEIIKTHSKIGSDMIDSLSLYKDEPLIKICHDICLNHHEKYDGKGYPNGIIGDDIPISAQIVSIADCYDALTSERCYKKAFSHDKAIEMILNGECGQFNPLIIQCLIECADEIKNETSRNFFAKDDVSFSDVNLINKHEGLNLTLKNIENINYLQEKLNLLSRINNEIILDYDFRTKTMIIDDFLDEPLGLDRIIEKPTHNEEFLSIIGKTLALEVYKQITNAVAQNKKMSFEIDIKGKTFLLEGGLIKNKEGNENIRFISRAKVISNDSKRIL